MRKVKVTTQPKIKVTGIPLIKNIGATIMLTMCHKL